MLKKYLTKKFSILNNISDTPEKRHREDRAPNGLNNRLSIQFEYFATHSCTASIAQQKEEKKSEKK